MVTEIAPAKINLALHVTGQRADGYHLLETLVTFADRGDTLTFALAEADSLSLSGRFASELSGGEQAPGGNLVNRARDLLRADLIAQGRAAPPVAIQLQKDLPIASGIGGGSADAAATLRGLMRLWGGTLSAQADAGLSLTLGADVPMCLHGRPLMARGIGEDLAPMPTLPAFAMVLANPLKPVSTPQIFKALTRKDNPPVALPDGLLGTDAWLSALGQLRNDLQPPAETLLPDIATLLTLLTETGARLTRMSGSGATCFGIFDDMSSANAAEKALRLQRPDWYFQAINTTPGE